MPIQIFLSLEQLQPASPISEEECRVLDATVPEGTSQYPNSNPDSALRR